MFLGNGYIYIPLIHIIMFGMIRASKCIYMYIYIYIYIYIIIAHIVKDRAYIYIFWYNNIIYIITVEYN